MITEGELQDIVWKVFIRPTNGAIRVGCSTNQTFISSPKPLLSSPGMRTTTNKFWEKSEHTKAMMWCYHLQKKSLKLLMPWRKLTLILATKIQNNVRGSRQFPATNRIIIVFSPESSQNTFFLWFGKNIVDNSTLSIIPLKRYLRHEEKSTAQNLLALVSDIKLTNKKGVF